MQGRRVKAGRNSTGQVSVKMSLSKWVLIAASATIVSVSLSNRPAEAVPYEVGDIFAGVGTGKVKHFDSSGTFIETLDTTTGSNEDTGMCFDATGNLYTTNFSVSKMSKFDNSGGLLQANFGSGFNADPESCVVDAAGNIYVGQADGTRDILKFDQAGNPLGTFDPATGPRGTDWIDLAADQCTMFYTSEGSSVKRFDVCTNTQLPNFATGLPAPCFALRIRANGEGLVACATQAIRLNPNGSVNMTYPIAGEFLFALNLDPDGTHFLTAGIFSGNIVTASLATLKLTRAEELLASPTSSPRIFSMAGWKQRQFNERLLDLFLSVWWGWHRESITK